MLRIVCGPAGCGKSTLVYREIGELAAQKKRALLIVPENMSHIAERRLLLSCGNSSAQYAHVSTFTRLSGLILDACGETRPTLDDGGRVLAMYRALYEISGRLEYYRGASLRPRLISAMLDAINEFIAANVSPAQLANAAAAVKKTKLADIAAIYDAYLSVCAQSRLDPMREQSRACAFVAQSGIFDGVSVYLDDFSGFSGQKRVFLSRILEKCASLTVTLLDGGDDAIFTEQRKTMAYLTSLAERASKKHEKIILPERTERAPELAAMRHICGTGGHLKAPVSAVSLYCAADPAEECELCAALVRRLTHSGARLRDIAVVCGGMNEYEGLLEGAFEKYDIPSFFARREGVLKKPALHAALGPLLCLERDMRSEAVLAWLKGGFTDIDRDSLEKLENYVLLWGIDGNRWFSPFTKRTCGFGIPAPDESERLALVEKARAICVKPIEKLKAELAGCADGGDFAQRLLEHIGRSELRSKLETRIESLARDGHRQEADECAQLYDILCGALSQMRGVLQDLRMDMSEFFHLLTLLLSQYDVSSIPSSLDCVTAGTFTGLSPWGIKHLIIIGARDGLMPPPVPSGSVISESERVELEGFGITLSRGTEKNLELQSDIYRALNSPQQSLTIIRPYSAGGSKCQQSPLLNQICALLPELREQTASAILQTLRLCAKKPLFELACRAVCDKNPQTLSAYAALRPQNAALFDFLAGYAKNPAPIITDHAVLSALYGDRLSITASRLEKLASCRFSYFCQYGLGAKKREEAAISALEAGTLVHFIVENAIRGLYEGRFSDVRCAADAAANEAVNTLPDADSPRMRALIEQISESARLVSEDVWEEICSSDFKPILFEANFGRDGLPPITWRDGDFELVLNGKADRIDRWNNYLKIIDYKTGNKTFALTDLLNGKNLQPFLYMMLAQNAGLGEGAAALYVHANAPYRTVKLDEEYDDSPKKRTGIVRAERDILEALEHSENGQFRRLPVVLKKDGGFNKRSSCVATGDEMGIIRDFTERKAKALAHTIVSGDVSATPLGDEPCKYCDYAPVCIFGKTELEKETQAEDFFEALKNGEGV